MVTSSGRTGAPATYSVGAQYEERSSVSLHVVRWPASDAGVEYAFVETFPTNVWSCERSGSPGRTIGSSGAEWLNRHVTRKNAPAGVEGAAAAPAASIPAATITVSARHQTT